MVDGYITLAEARATQASLLERAVPVIASEVMSAARRGAFSGHGPIFLGIGASYAASAAAVWTLRSRGIDAYRLNAGEYPIPFPPSPHPIIGVSQSGRSSETLAVLGAVEGRLRMAVSNVVPSPISDIATTAISLGNLPDSYASTTGYTATIAALGMIAEAWDNGVIDRGWTALPAALRQLEATLASRIGSLASLLVDPRSVDYAAAASSVGSAEVGALLLREVARIPATGFSTRQYLHGAMESAGHTVHILMGEEREIGLAQTLARAGHNTILLTGFDVPEEHDLHVVRIPTVSPAQRPILEALVLQSLAVEAALLRGLDPDAFVFFHTDTKVAAQ